jgi:hypothetical protein
LPFFDKEYSMSFKNWSSAQTAAAKEKSDSAAIARDEPAATPSPAHAAGKPKPGSTTAVGPASQP